MEDMFGKICLCKDKLANRENKKQPHVYTVQLPLNAVLVPAYDVYMWFIHMYICSSHYLNYSG